MSKPPPDQIDTLKLYLMGGDLDLLTAMRRLEIQGDPIEVSEALLDEKAMRCRTCRRWCDSDVMEDGRCMRCDEFLNPSNRERNYDN